MIDVLTAGASNLFVELLTAGLRTRGFETELTSPEPTALSLAVTRSQPELCLIDQRVLDRAKVVLLVGAAVAAGGGRTRVVVLSGVSDDETVWAMRSAGARGFVHTSTGMDELLRALDTVRAGREAIRLPRSHRGEPSVRTDWHRRATALTARERECLGRLVDGASTAAMADMLGISELTVRSHVQRLLQKLGAHTRLEAASLAVRYGLLDEPGRHPVPISRVG